MKINLIEKLSAKQKIILLWIGAPSSVVILFILVNYLMPAREGIFALCNTETTPSGECLEYVSDKMTCSELQLNSTTALNWIASMSGRTNVQPSWVLSPMACCVKHLRNSIAVY